MLPFGSATTATSPPFSIGERGCAGEYPQECGEGNDTGTEHTSPTGTDFFRTGCGGLATGLIPWSPNRCLNSSRRMCARCSGVSAGRPANLSPHCVWLGEDCVFPTLTNVSPGGTEDVSMLQHAHFRELSSTLTGQCDVATTTELPDGAESG